MQTLAFARTLRRGAPPAYPLQTWPRPLQFLHLLLLSTIATFPILVTAIFWSLLSSPATLATPYSAWTNISGHAFNTLFVGVDILFSNVAPALPRRAGSGIGLPWVHVPFLILLLGGYLGVAYVTYATQGFYSTSAPFHLIAPPLGGIAAPYHMLTAPRPQRTTSSTPRRSTRSSQRTSSASPPPRSSSSSSSATS